MLLVEMLLIVVTSLTDHDCGRAGCRIIVIVCGGCGSSVFLQYLSHDQLLLLLLLRMLMMAFLLLCMVKDKPSRTSSSSCSSI